MRIRNGDMVMGMGLEIYDEKGDSLLEKTLLYRATWGNLTLLCPNMDLLLFLRFP